MPFYYINSYDIVDAEEFSKYAPAVIPLLKKYGAEVLAADVEGIAVEGKPRKMNAIIQFPSVESALECYNSAEYKPIKEIRLRSTSNCTMILVKGIAEEK
jgi:uncharacterized protein (DUF1330 family)